MLCSNRQICNVVYTHISHTMKTIIVNFMVFSVKGYNVVLVLSIYVATNVPDEPEVELVDANVSTG